jgi:hypothetical protein
LKVLGSPETLFQKGFWWGAGATPLPDKPKFENFGKGVEISPKLLQNLRICGII